MNKARRAALAKVAERLEEWRLELETLQQEEQDYLDNLPENMQCGERAERSQDAISAIEEAGNSVASAIESIEGVS